MSYEFLIYDKPEDGIARITLNRPEVLNALSTYSLQELYDAAAEAAADDSVVVLIYRGTGRSFCVGRDFKHSAELQKTEEGWFAWRKRYKGFGPQTWLHPKATIAAVQGHALGGGHNLAVGCDLTIIADNAKFGYPEARYGQLAGRNHMWNWLVGPKKTKEYLFTGRNMDAEEALRIGLVNHVVPLAELDEFSMTMARDIVNIERKNPGYIRLNKMDINYLHQELMMYTTLNPDVAAQKALETEFITRMKKSQEAFYDNVSEKGIHAAMDKMHSGFSSKGNE